MPEDTVVVVGVRFKRAGKLYYFKPGDLELHPRDQVLVETAAGMEIGEVVIPAKAVPAADVVQPVRRVVRRVDERDAEQLLANRESEERARAVAAERIAARGLAMKLVNAEYTFDRNRLTFFFVAEDRVDFRELVRDLANEFGVRIELRQIGVRDQAKELGGIGVCGRELCCTTWLGEFEPVSIRMAKDQQLSLNPSKLTGQCGRLKCCLKFENDTYRRIRNELPEPGALVNTREGTGKVLEVLVAREGVLVDVGEGRRVFVSLKELESGEAAVLTGTRARRPGQAAAAAGDVPGANQDLAAAREDDPEPPSPAPGAKTAQESVQELVPADLPETGARDASAGPRGDLLRAGGEQPAGHAARKSRRRRSKRHRRRRPQPSAGEETG